MNLLAGLFVYLLAMLPITELQASIPIGMEVYGLPVGLVFILSIAGSTTSAFLVLWLLPIVVDFLAKHFAPINKAMHWIFARTRSKAAHHFVKYGQWGLIIFMAIPGPGSGVWTSALVAYLFDVPKKRALGLIFVGTLWLGILIVLITKGAVKGLDFFLK